MAGNIFEQIKKINEYRQEFWRARDLYKLLGYTEYGKFLPAIARAKEACKNSSQTIELHFADVSEPQKSRNQYGEIEGQLISDYHLSRYACDAGKVTNSRKYKRITETPQISNR